MFSRNRSAVENGNATSCAPTLLSVFVSRPEPVLLLTRAFMGRDNCTLHALFPRDTFLWTRGANCGTNQR
jgi:hypothetical protein